MPIKFKTAELTGTDAMPLAPTADTKPGKEKAVVKTGFVTAPVPAEEPLTPVERVKVARWAVRSQFPLDSYSQVKTASAYFDEHVIGMPLEDRRAFAANLTKRAEELNIHCSDLARDYGAPTYAPAFKLAAGIRSRKDAVLGDVNHAVLDKIASIRSSVPPEVYRNLLSEFDEQHGLYTSYGGAVIDPILSTYGYNKQAEFAETIEMIRVTETKLRDLCESRHVWLAKQFSPEMVSKFSKDPVGTYQSLPDEQKKIIARMVRSAEPGVTP